MPRLKLNAFSKYGSIIIELISTILIIIALILLIVQGCDNDKFKKNDNREIKTEKFLYSIFSQEIYTNLKKNIFFANQQDDENTANSYLNADIMINSYFDCRGVTDGELNEDKCQDKIINNRICCKAECCSKTNGGEVFCSNYNFQVDNPNINNHKILSYDREEYFDDPRRRFCTYFNKYDRTIDNFNTQLINIKNENYTYEDLLLNQVSYACINYTQCHENYTDCGIIDTLNRHLYVSNGLYCPINNIKYGNNEIILESIYDGENNNVVNIKHIILRNILSEIPPILHEKSHFDFNYYNNLYDIDILNEDITAKDINNLLKKGKNIYNKISNVELSLNDFKINSGMKDKAKFNWYTTNYIGFKTIKDYLQFKKYFSENYFDASDNLHKICNKIYPHFKHIIASFPLLFIFLLYIIILCLSLSGRFKLKRQLFKGFFIARLVLLICMFILEIICYAIFINEFEEINIDMDENFKEILDLYNKRRFQIKFLLSIIFLSLAFIPVIIFFILNCETSNPVNEAEQEDNNNKNDTIEEIYNDNDRNNNTIIRNSRNNEKLMNQVSESSRNLISKENKLKNSEIKIINNNNESKQKVGKGMIIPFKKKNDNENSNSINNIRTINVENNINNIQYSIGPKISNEQEINIDNKENEDIKESKNNNIKEIKNTNENNNISYINNYSDVNIYYRKDNNNDDDYTEVNLDFKDIGINKEDEYKKLGINRKKVKKIKLFKKAKTCPSLIRFDNEERYQNRITKRKLTDPKKDNKTTLETEITKNLKDYKKDKK